MNVVFVAKKVTLTDDFKQKAEKKLIKIEKVLHCLLYTSDAADD